MIEIKDDTKEKCQDCPMFSPETTCNKFYGENKREKSNLELWAEDEVNIIEVESDITLGGLE